MTSPVMGIENKVIGVQLDADRSYITDTCNQCPTSMVGGHDGYGRGKIVIYNPNKWHWRLA